MEEPSALCNVEIVVPVASNNASKTVAAWSSLSDAGATSKPKLLPGLLLGSSLAAALLCSAQSWAHEPTTAQVQVQAWVVGTHLSEPGESRDEFVMRLAGIMQAWTDETGNELCGYIATDGERWGARLTTQRAQLLCFFAAQVVPDGMKATNETIHTHPSTNGTGYLQITPDTRAALRAAGDRVMLRQIKQAGGRRKADVDGFSPHDFAAGPGYLVVNGKLLHQAGQGTEREVGAIADAQFDIAAAPPPP